MLNKSKSLKGYKLKSLDGEIGRAKEFYFDDLHWTIRYLVVDTGNWLIGRQVLISPYALVAVVKEREHIALNLTKRQIENSPSLDSDKPVSKQFEDNYHKYFGWPLYWNGPNMWGLYPEIIRDNVYEIENSHVHKAWDPHLQSTNYVTDFTIHAIDSDIGHVEDFIIDDETWAIRYLIIDTRKWWSGKKVLVSTRWVERVSWDESKVFVNLSKEAIIRSPEYSEITFLTKEYEAKLHDHYNREGYWE